MPDFEIRESDQGVEIRGPHGCSPEQLKEAVEIILPILKTSLAIDLELATLADDLPKNRPAAFAAMMMKSQALSKALVLHNEATLDVLKGRRAVGEFGFPEFDDDAETWRYD